MSNIEMPPFTGEMPNTLLAGLINDPGVIHTPLFGGMQGRGELETDTIGDLGTGPVRSCGVINEPGAVGNVNSPGVLRFGVMGSPPGPGHDGGVMDVPPKGWIDQT